MYNFIMMKRIKSLLLRLQAFENDWFFQEEDRLHARMTRTLIVLVLGIYLLPEFVEIWQETGGHFNNELLLVTGVGLLFMAAFWLTRTRHHYFAGRLLLLAWFLDIILDWAWSAQPNNERFILLVILALVQAFLLLRWWDYILFFFIVGVGIALTRHWAGAATHDFDWTIYVLAGALLGMGNWLYRRDQAARQASQNALQHERDYLQDVIDAVASPFYVIDVKDYSIVTANAAARALGLSDGHSTCYALTHRRETPCTGADHPCPLQQIHLTHEPFVVEHKHYRQDGTPYFVEVHGYPVFDEFGNLVQMVEYALDITARKQAESEIRRLQKAVEHAATGVAITDEKGVFVYANPAMSQMTGYSPDEVIGQYSNLLKSGQHDDAFYKNLWDTIESGQVWQGEMLNRRKDGSLYWEFQTIAPVYDEKGRITNYVAIKEDITERKQMEADLRAAKEQAEAASALKERLLSNVSHDMRTPLGAMMGFAEMLLSGVYGDLQEAQRAPLQSILSGTRRLNAFINGMLTRAELDSGKLKIRAQAFSPSDLLAELDEYAEVARRKGLDFTRQVADDVPQTLYEDTYWLRQILTNLVDNAIKYTPEGAITVRVKRVDDAHWALEVSDTGLGIDPALHDHIFDAFEQAESGPGKSIAGIGLGLSIVRKLAEVLGGEIILESAPAQGSTFTVILPIKEQTDES